MRLTKTSLNGDANLIAHYPFDGNSNDASGGGRNGTDSNISYVGGKWASAADGNGTTSDIDVASFSSDFLATGGSIAGWIYIDTMANSKRILQLDDGNTAALITTNASGPDCSLGFTHFCDVTDGIWRTTDRVLSSGGWYHIGITYDRSGGVGENPIIYINGVSVGVTETQTPVAPLRTSIDQINFLSDGAGSAFLDAKIDDWVFFTREITVGEMAELAAGEPPSGNAIFFSTGGLTLA